MFFAHLCFMDQSVQSYDQALEIPEISSTKTSVFFRRLDLIHPLINGNKWFKLKYNLEKARSTEHRTILSFGGAFSNHLHALAAAGWLHGIKTIGIVRGERPPVLSDTLQFALQCGMQLHFITREAYQLKETEDFKAWLHQQFGAFVLVPEGGSNYLGVNGCMEMLDSSDLDAFDLIVCAAGTGATAAGIALKMGPTQKLLVFPALKNGEYIRESILKNLMSVVPDEAIAREIMTAVSVETAFHFGGYARTTPELIQFILDFEEKYKIPLDQVYTGKMMYGLLNLLINNHLKPEQRILVIHSGGLQGRHSIPELRSR